MLNTYTWLILINTQASGGLRQYILRSFWFYLFRIDIGPDSPQWVGAWWIGFLITGVMALFVSVPILAFPKSLPGKPIILPIVLIQIQCFSPSWLFLTFFNSHHSPSHWTLPEFFRASPLIFFFFKSLYKAFAGRLHLLCDINVL